jgi:c(7)-type cytochrome triheme protein
MYRARLLLSAAVAATISAGANCRSAAQVILDLPEPEAQSQVPAQRTTAAEAVAAERERAPSPAEVAQTPDSVLALLPRHSSGGIDWSAALRRGVIGGRSEGPRFGFDFYFGAMETYFPHSTHSEWLSCQSCHPAIYRTRQPSKTSMAEIQAGESCGVCHGKVAFGPEVCERCHEALQMPEDRIAPRLATDLVLPRDSAAGAEEEFPHSIFAHWKHRIRYLCVDCHPAPFTMKRGADKITMRAIQQGEFCGECHDGRQAFGVVQCTRCHRSPPDPVEPPKPESNEPG